MPMTPLISCQMISKSYGSRHLFQEISLGLFRNDKMGLIGPNGSGKSTFLKILAGIDSADDGEVVRQRSTRIGYVPQETHFDERSLLDILIHAQKDDARHSADYLETQAIIILSKLGFDDSSKSASSLSGGWKKRLAIAVELVREPDVLLLDEPTNHLDLEGVIWLEKFLYQSSFAYIVISHDRCFLEHITTRMMELNKSYPKGLFIAEGAYSLFLEKRQEFLSGQLQQERSLSSKVRREEEWLKQNPKARTTKSSSRIQEANRLIGELQEIKGRNRETRTQIDFSSSKRESQKLVVATNLGKSMGDRVLFSGIDLTLSPGMRLGIVGLNGSGKTTLLRLLAGELTADKGTLKYADNLKIVYFDQHRAHLPDTISLRQALAPDGEYVNYRGQSIHVNSWCKRFLFSPDRLDLPFRQLSGGERARVHIARLMLQPADLLLLDEPTNDLDIPTLEILEESLLEFSGAIVLISHDRYLLDQISNVLIGLGTESDDKLFADYKQWEDHQAQLKTSKSSKAIESKSKKEEEVTKTIPSKKMSYNEKRELEQTELKITQTEKKIESLQTLINDPAVINQSTKFQETCQQLGEQQHQLELLYHRWQELEAKNP
jgi:ABC transport system ATP-binding/permease protein